MRKRTERTVLRRLQSPQPSSHPNPTVIVSFLVLKCSQVTWLWVFKSRYDLLEEVKSLEELSGGKSPAKGQPCPSPSVLPSRVHWPLPSLSGSCHSTLSLDCRCVPLLGRDIHHYPPHASNMPSSLAS